MSSNATSDTCIESPQSCESPYSSPSQQVPELTSSISGLSCNDNLIGNNNGPYLRIIEEPQTHFRFRYKSEMMGTHGCLLGQSSANKKTKSHPTVELLNWKGDAIIRCSLVQCDNTEEHPHKLLEDDKDQDVYYKIPENGSYRVGFAGMAIIHTAKKEVPSLLFDKLKVQYKNCNAKELKQYCDNLAKKINLNIVRLKFSAHDVNTNNEICRPVYSKCINNMKSAATNDLKICRSSRSSGRPKGGDDVFILVEKVNKKNIEVHFTELDENGEVCWSEKASFIQSDVHHQYAIVFRTPQYKNPQISSDVIVQMQLVRPSDGQVSVPLEFKYRADQIYRQNKKRKANSSFSSLGSYSSGSIKSVVNIPTVVTDMHDEQFDKLDEGMYSHDFFKIPEMPAPPEGSPLSDVLYAEVLKKGPVLTEESSERSPMFSQPNVPAPPPINLDSTELDRLLRMNNNLNSEEIKQFMNSNYYAYITNVYGAELNTDECMKSFEWLSETMIADSGCPQERSKTTIKHKRKDEDNVIEIKKERVEYDKVTQKDYPYTAHYSEKDGAEVKKLVRELYCLIKTHDYQGVRGKLEQLLEIQLSNKDTFLHMMLHTNRSAFKNMVKLIHKVGMTNLLNLANEQQHTILHDAIINNIPDLVPLLISQGCDPMLEDLDGNNAFHLAVMNQNCLEPLLTAIKENKVTCDLNAYNNEKQTPLHLAVIYESASSVKQLALHGADLDARDLASRTALHIAAFSGTTAVLRALLHYTAPNDIDAVDGCGNTALQIACELASQRNMLLIIEMLLKNKADPLVRNNQNKCAWDMIQEKSEIREIMQKYVKEAMLFEIEIKSEPEDDFDSADDEECDDQ